MATFTFDILSTGSRFPPYFFFFYLFTFCFCHLINVFLLIVGFTYLHCAQFFVEKKMEPDCFSADRLVWSDELFRPSVNRPVCTATNRERKRGGEDGYPPLKCGRYYVICDNKMLGCFR